MKIGIKNEKWNENMPFFVHFFVLFLVPFFWLFREAGWIGRKIIYGFTNTAIQNITFMAPRNRDALGASLFIGIYYMAAHWYS